MNIFDWLKGRVKIRKASVKINHKDAPALDKVADDLNTLTGAAIDKVAPQAQAAAESAAAKFAKLK